MPNIGRPDRFVAGATLSVDCGWTAVGGAGGFATALRGWHILIEANPATVTFMT